VARSPSKVELRIEPVIRKRVVIRADIVGALPDGYQIQGIELTPHEVVLEGARGSLRRLREISTRTVDVSGLTETTSQQVPLVLEAGQVWRVGARGEPVEVKILIQAPDNGTEPE
jgi:YbbR domain-containing protein